MNFAVFFTFSVVNLLRETLRVVSMVVEFASFAWSLKIEVASQLFSLFFCANFLLDFRWIRNMVSVVYCQVLFIEGKGKLRVISWKCRFPLGACYLFGFSRSPCRPCIELLWIYNQVVTIVRNMKWYRIFRQIVEFVSHLTGKYARRQSSTHSF